MFASIAKLFLNVLENVADMISSQHFLDKKSYQHKGLNLLQLNGMNCFYKN